MSHQHLDNINIETNIRGFQSRVLVDLESALIKQLILNPNDKIPPHQVPVDVTFFVLEGEGYITIGANRHEVKQHSVVICPRNTVMNVEAKNNRFTFLNIKTPGFKPQK